MSMIPDLLYDIALQFRKTKLWKKLYDSQLFAVAHSDGTIGYCSVMGMMGKHLALAVYPGAEGMDSYRAMGKDRSEMNELEEQETMLSQNCVMLAFVNKDEIRPRELAEVRAYCAVRRISLHGRSAFPQFQRFRPHYFPWYVEDEKDQTRLLEALEACLEVSAKLDIAGWKALGFTEGVPYDRRIPLLEKKEDEFAWDTIALPEPLPVVYPSPEARDDIALAKITKSQKRGLEWACDVFMHVSPMSDEAGENETIEEPKNAPFFPYLLLIVDNKTGTVLHIQISDDPEDYTEGFTRTVLEVAQGNGRPSRILVRNERARTLFSKLSVQLGAELVMEKSVPMLEEAEQSFFENFDRNEDLIEEEMSELMETLQDSRVFPEIPDEVLLQLRQMEQAGALPDAVAENVRRESKRRGFK
jgi:hypothetical protein